MKTVVWRPLKIAQDVLHDRQMGLPSVESARLPERLLLLRGLCHQHAPLWGLRPALGAQRRPGRRTGTCDGSPRGTRSDTDRWSSSVREGVEAHEPRDDAGRAAVI
jgi:hypothetical protein